MESSEHKRRRAFHFLLYRFVYIGSHSKFAKGLRRREKSNLKAKLHLGSHITFTHGVTVEVGEMGVGLTVAKKMSRRHIMNANRHRSFMLWSHTMVLYDLCMEVRLT